MLLMSFANIHHFFFLLHINPIPIIFSVKFLTADGRLRRMDGSPVVPAEDVEHLAHVALVGKLDLWIRPLLVVGVLRGDVLVLLWLLRFSRFLTG